MLHAQTPAAYAAALRWAHMPVTLLLLSLAAFTYLYLRRRPAVAGADRPRAAPALDAVQLHCRREPQLPRDPVPCGASPFLGDTVAIPFGVPNPGC